MKTIEEMYSEICGFCSDNSCGFCPIRDLCNPIGGQFRKHEDAIIEAYKRISMGTEREEIMENNVIKTKPTNVQKHMEIATELNQLYERKNRDYGDSFHISFLEEGMAMARIRLGDKLNRFKTLTKSDQQEVKDESIRDTLIDLANYAIMTVMELDRKE